MSPPLLLPVYAIGTVNFLDALATGAATAINSLQIPLGGGSRRYTITAIRVLTMEAISPLFWFYGSATGETSDVDTDSGLGAALFDDASAVQLGGSGLYRWYAEGLNIPYHDADAANSVSPPRLHVILQNQSTTAKSANAAGAINAIFYLAPQQTVQG